MNEHYDTSCLAPNWVGTGPLYSNNVSVEQINDTVYAKLFAQFVPMQTFSTASHAHDSLISFGDVLV